MMDDKLREEILDLVRKEFRVQLSELGVEEVSVADELPEDSGNDQWLAARPLGRVADFVVYCVQTVHKTVKIVAVPLTYLSVLTFAGNLLAPNSVPTAKELAVTINAAFNSKNDLREFKPQPGPPISPKLFAYRDEAWESLNKNLTDEELSSIVLVAERRVGKKHLLDTVAIPPSGTRRT